jgi:hypothetical protein
LKAIDASNDFIAKHRSSTDMLFEIVEHAPSLVDVIAYTCLAKTKRDRKREDISRRS